MINREVVSFGKPRVLACDAKCGKAWGIQNRPRVDLSNGMDPDDFFYVPDGELGEAPLDPGTYEGGHAKPQMPDERLNRWCSRACERSAHADSVEGIVLPDYDRPHYNRKSRQEEADALAGRASA